MSETDSLEIREAVKWEPGEIDGHPVYVGTVTDGFLIASTAQPKFCFFGNSKEEALGKSYRALAFYRHAAPKEQSNG